MGEVGAYVASGGPCRKRDLPALRRAGTRNRIKLLCHAYQRLEGTKVFRVGLIPIAALLLGLALQPQASAQKSASLSTAGISEARTGPVRASKTELANRFLEIKARHAGIKSAAAKFVPLKDDAPLQLRIARSKISAAMHSYDLYEAQTKKQRDRLNLLTELNATESARLQMAMDRLAKMSGTIASLMKQINETGDAMLITCDSQWDLRYECVNGVSAQRVIKD